MVVEIQKAKKFKLSISNGESIVINVAEIVEDIPKFRQKLSKYCLNDLWNANEFRLMYKSTSKSTIGPARIPRRNN